MHHYRRECLGKTFLSLALTFSLALGTALTCVRAMLPSCENLVNKNFICWLQISVCVRVCIADIFSK
jgi:hypothetical protein